jgi:hypothetical protein
VARQGTAMRGLVWHGSAYLGMAWLGVVRDLARARVRARSNLEWALEKSAGDFGCYRFS